MAVKMNKLVENIHTLLEKQHKLRLTLRDFDLY